MSFATQVSLSNPGMHQLRWGEYWLTFDPFACSLSFQHGALPQPSPSLVPKMQVQVGVNPVIKSVFSVVFCHIAAEVQSLRLVVSRRRLLNVCATLSYFPLKESKSLDADDSV